MFKSSFFIPLLLIVFMLQSQAAFGEDLKIAFWNVENLFDNHRDKRTPREDLFVSSALKEKIRKDGEIIREIDADILGLMEVENRGVLQQLVDSELSEMGYQYTVLIDVENERGIDVALVSRHPFLCYSYDVPEFYRGILTARFAVNGRPFYVIVNHWKSRFGGGQKERMNCSKRVVEIVEKLIPDFEGRSDVPIIIGGDLNDNDTDASVVNLEENGLINTLKSIPLEDRWTLPYFNRDINQVELDTFDHLFINNAAKVDGPIQWVSSSVLRPKRMMTTRTINGVEHMWPDDDHQNHIGYSDHFPVISKFKLKKCSRF